MDPVKRSTQPALREVAGIFAVIGSFTFGGGSATIAALEREIVHRRGWFDRERFALCFALARMTPGTNLLAFCTASGWTVRRLPGAAIALLAASLPCSVVAVILTRFIESWTRHHIARAFQEGVVVAAVGSLIATAWLLLRPYWTPNSRFRTAVFTVLALSLSLGLRQSPITILAVAAAAGYLWPGDSK